MTVAHDFTGRLEGLPIGDYHAAPHLSSSGVSDILKSPAHYKHKVWTDTKAKRIGSGVHVLLLEPEQAALLLPQPPDVNKRTKAGREEFTVWEAGLGPDATILSSDEREVAEKCAASLRGTKFAKRFRMFEPDTVQTEVSLFAKIDTEDGPCFMRARPDIVHPARVLVDVKTSRDADPEGFMRHAYNFGYHRQEALYRRVAAAAGVEVERFAFAVVETDAPYSATWYELPEALIEEGDRAVLEAARVWARCTRENRWPGYPDDQITTLEPKPWMLRFPEDTL